MPAISRAGRAPTGEWRGWGSVGADLIRESRRRFRPSRTRSATPSGKHETRRMVLSEAIPISATAWVSQAQPILRKAPRRGLQDSCSYARASRNRRSGPCPRFGFPEKPPSTPERPFRRPSETPAQKVMRHECRESPDGLQGRTLDGRHLVRASVAGNSRG